jgi:hypothetical protein
MYRCFTREFPFLEDDEACDNQAHVYADEDCYVTGEGKALIFGV